MSNSNPLNSVEDYFNEQSTQAKLALLEIKACIFRVVPNATELFNYNIPAYALIEGGKREQQIMIAGYKNHVGFYPHPTTIERFDSELSKYKSGKGSVQFPLDKPLPIKLIERMIKYRAELLKKM